VKSFVLDSSIAMTWCFEDEKTSYTEALLDAVSEGTEVLVPALWPYEVLNVLVMAQRRKRMTQAQALHFWRELQALPIHIEEKPAGYSSLEIMTLAQQHQLTAYDAAYLDLALREGLPLASLDEDLKKAAQSAGVPIASVEPKVNPEDK
jgi:predicted nucleic acid-binding protein